MSGIYIHIPFCSSKCIYCGFYSVANTKLKADYLEALHQEINLRKTYLEGTTVKTLYFGGGTPSLLSIAELKEILEQLQESFDLRNVEEITLEANPEQLTPAYSQGLRDIGINRLSIGVQSFQDSILQFMGRRHTAQEAIAAVHNASDAGFDNISIDLIYGVNERNDEQWRQEVETALTLPIQHLSCYALTSEENSILYKQIKNQKHDPVDDEQAARQYGILLEMLKDTPIQHYEVSNFARAGYESKHNSAYWNHTPYLGLGPAAHSFNGNSRQWNAANLRQYCRDIRSGEFFEGAEDLEEKDIYNEQILLGLRTRTGLSLKTIAERYGKARANDLLQYFEHHVPNSRYEKIGDTLRLTPEGLWFADGIAEDAFIIED